MPEKIPGEARTSIVIIPYFFCVGDAMARRTGGMKLLSGLSVSDEAKARFAAIFATMTGEKSILEVCKELGIGEPRFHAMRKEFLAEAVNLLEKRPAGRKPVGGEESPELSRLRDENEKLRLELTAAQIQAEIAMVMPHVLKRPNPSKKTKGRKRPH